MDKMFVDALYLKSDHKQSAALLITQVAFRFGFRACTVQQSKTNDPEPVTHGVETWDTGSGWDAHFEHVKKRLDRLTAKTRPAKKVVIPLVDLRACKVTCNYECSLITNNSKTWFECVLSPIKTASVQSNGQ